MNVFKLALVGCMVAGNVVAEPLTGGTASPATANPAQETPQRRSANGSDGAGLDTPGIADRSAMGADMPSTSKTVDLLLEMQGKNPGLAAGERPKAEVPVSRPSANVSQPSAKPAFGADTAASAGVAELPRSTAAAGEPNSVDWTAPAPSAFGGSLSSGGANPPRAVYGPGPGADPVRPKADAEDVFWLIPRHWVRFVRENRDTVVLGSIGMLLLLWAVSALKSGRRK